MWQQIRQLEPSRSEAYFELSRLAQVQRNDIAAVQILEQALASGIQDPKLSMALAALALKQQDWAKALSYLHYEPDIFNYTDFYALKAAALQKPVNILKLCRCFSNWLVSNLNRHVGGWEWR